MLLNEVAALLNDTRKFDANIDGVSIDSRTLLPGQLFIAIKGDQFDGHRFISDAEKRGAVAVVASEAMEGLQVPLFIVPDTIAALGKLAAYHRTQCSCEVIALTGSNGKTTVKEMIATILPEPRLATKGNLNNHIGVPLSVLMLNKAHRYAVFELGANHTREIAYTVEIAKPNVVLVNNVAPAHIEGFGSIEGVARAKGEIYQGIPQDGTAVINDDDGYAHFWDAALIDKKVLRFSVTKPSAVHAQDIHFNDAGFGEFTLVVPGGTADIQLQVAGLHNVSNAVAAAACTFALGFPILTIAEGLNQFRGVGGRLTVLRGKNKATVIDDTYNANLRSTLAALDVLAQRPGRRIFVFGDMGELGHLSASHHQEVGVVAKKHGIEVLLACGKHTSKAADAFGPTGQHFASQEALVEALRPQLDESTTVLVKGSRSSAMEKIVKQLLC
jgi:UDP-N-acetylmuramoyl-tripeptide--D-alanyl-D-alanine ligase